MQTRLHGLVVVAALVVVASPARSRVLEQVQKLEDSRLSGVEHVAITPDGRYAYVGAGRGTAVYERDPETGAFRFVETFGPGTAAATS